MFTFFILFMINSSILVINTELNEGWLFILNFLARRVFYLFFN